MKLWRRLFNRLGGQAVLGLLARSPLRHDLRAHLSQTLPPPRFEDYLPTFAYYRHADGELIPLWGGYRERARWDWRIAPGVCPGQMWREVNGERFLDERVIAVADDVRQRLSRWIDVTGKDVLEIGCGMGAVSLGLAAAGAKSVAAAEVDFDYYERFIPGHRLVLARHYAPGSGTDAEGLLGRVRYVTDDVQASGLGAESFDLIVSNSVLEHIRDLPAGLAEMARLLRSGGLMFHAYDPFFNAAGGHAHASLDFPWGHVRLTPAEFDDYVEEYRAFEVELAKAEYRQAFGEPKLTLAELEETLKRVGFEIVDWQELERTEFRPYLTDRVLAQCRRTYPTLTERDLLNAGVTIVAQRL